MIGAAPSPKDQLGDGTDLGCERLGLLQEGMCYETFRGSPEGVLMRDEHEFFAHQDVMARMNPQLRVTQVAMGVHVNGGCTVFWGLVHLDGQKIGRGELETALVEAGFDLKHNGPLQKLNLTEINKVAS